MNTNKINPKYYFFNYPLNTSTILNEGANRGIIVTTSSYGGDSYEFAKDKPITLLDGSNLLHLLQKHGYSFRIDLKEARLSTS